MPGNPEIPIFPQVLHEVAGEYVYAEYLVYVTAQTVGGALSDFTGVPQPGDPYHYSTPKLLLEEREATCIKPNAETTPFAQHRFQIKCIFRKQIPSDTPTDPDLMLAQHGGAGLNQIATSLDKQGNPIQLTYTPSGGGEPVTEVVEFNVLAPQQTFTREIIVQNADPDEVVATFIGKVNSQPWRNEDPHMWLCTDVRYELVRRGTDQGGDRTYRFTFTFERSDKPQNMGGQQAGWRYMYSYRNSAGKIPSDVSSSNGMAMLAWHEAIDFSQLFPSQTTPS